MDPPPYEAVEKGGHHGAPAPNPPYPTGLAPPGGPGAPPQAGFVMPQPQSSPYLGAGHHQQTVVVTSQPVLYPVSGTSTVYTTPQGTAVFVGPVHLPLPPSSSRYQCKSCNEDIITNVNYLPGTRTHLIGILLCLFGCWCCVPIPYCSNDCKDAHHHCPHCGAYIGVSARN